MNNKFTIRTWEVYKIIDELAESKYEFAAFKRAKDNKIYRIAKSQIGTLGLYNQNNLTGNPLLLMLPINENWEYIKDIRLLEVENLKKQINGLENKINLIIEDINKKGKVNPVQELNNIKSDKYKVPKDTELLYPIDKIIVPRIFKTPREYRYNNYENYYKEHGTIDKAIVVVQNTFDKNYVVIKDGYIRYLILKNNGAKNIPVKFVSVVEEK